ncbi:hypothetical protein ACE1SV_22550 [Streptomyces sp. E-15]
MQKPSVRPGRSPRARPTGTPQSAREQNRLRSGTSGSASTIARGSGRGTCGTETSPAPSRPRVEAPDEAPEPRTDTERPVGFPDTDRDSRPETERRDLDTGDDVPEPPEPPEPPLPGLPVIPVAGEATVPFADTTGARPHVPQYSSPPPTSS